MRTKWILGMVAMTSLGACQAIEGEDDVTLAPSGESGSGGEIGAGGSGVGQSGAGGGKTGNGGHAGGGIGGSAGAGVGGGSSGASGGSGKSGNAGAGGNAGAAAGGSAEKAGGAGVGGAGKAGASGLGGSAGEAGASGESGVGGVSGNAGEGGVAGAASGASGAGGASAGAAGAGGDESGGASGANAGGGAAGSAGVAGSGGVAGAAGAGAAGAAGSGGACLSPKQECGTTCTNVATDDHNCGACSNDCAALPDVGVTSCSANACVVKSCAAGFANCNSLVSDGCEVDTTSDASNCGMCGTVCPGLETCVAKTCTCPIIYVSTKGSDANNNDGCDINAPLATVGAAIKFATASPSVGQEIHVCAGTYAEGQLTLATPTSLRGEYNCMTWARSAGFPDATNPTTLAYGGTYTKAAPATLVVSGVGITSSVIIDGLTITGPASAGAAPPDASIGLDFMSNASPVVKNVTVTGGGVPGAGSGDTPADLGPTAVRIASGAAPEIAFSTLDGGASNKQGSARALLVLATAGAPHVHDTVLTSEEMNGSSLVSIFGTAPMTEAAGTAFEHNTLNPPSPGSNVGVNPIDVESKSGAVDILANEVKGSITGEGSGIYLSTGAAIRIVGNRISGPLQRTYEVGGIGINGTQTGSLLITDNMILGASTTPYGGTTGVYLGPGTTGAILRHNTIMSGPATGGFGVISQYFSAAIQINSAGSVIENNILIGSGVKQANIVDVGIMFYAACPGNGEPASLQNNLFINFADSLAQLEPGGCNSQPALATIDDLAVGISSRDSSTTSASILTNYVMRTTCPSAPAETHCIPGCGSPSCLFSAFSSDAGYTTLFGTGWLLQGNDPCAVTTSALNDIASDPVDLFGVTRTAAPSMGAAEFDGTCK